MKTRFCPSPTGYIHLGNARTALFNYLAAMSDKGVFLFRIEDTDLERSKTAYIDALKVDLHWLGMRWQEGVDVGGDHGPYVQSERQAIYDEYYQKLEQEGAAYPCFCSEAQLALARKIQRSQGQAPRYPGTCRHLTEAEIAEKKAAGIQPVLRFRVPNDEVIEFEDVVRGKQQFNSNDIGDFIIRRANGMTSFMYCNAIDDALMEVSIAMRGEDHLTNSPRQILILKALGLKAPQYAHISLITGSDGSPLSKRHGSKSIADLRGAGFLPEAVVNYLARLGHTYENTAFMSSEALCEQFQLSHLGKAPAKYDEAQLHYWQKQAVSQLSIEAFGDWLGKAVLDQVPAQKQALFLEAIQPNVLFPADAQDFCQRFFEDNVAFDDGAKAILEAADKVFFVCLKQALIDHGEDYLAIVEALKVKAGVKGKALFQPLRVLLTGQLHGPELAKVLTLIGANRALARIEKGLMSVKDL